MNYCKMTCFKIVGNVIGSQSTEPESQQSSSQSQTTSSSTSQSQTTSSSTSQSQTTSSSTSQSQTTSSSTSQSQTTSSSSQSQTTELPTAQQNLQFDNLPSDIAQHKSDAPQQPKNVQFPSRQYMVRQREVSR